jgi:hypothetical protein
VHDVIIPLDRQHSSEIAASKAENLVRSCATRTGDIVPLFAAFVGFVFQRDESVGHDVLTALDRFVSSEGACDMVPQYPQTRPSDHGASSH